MTAVGRTIALSSLLLIGPAGCYGTSPPPPIYLGQVANLSGSASGRHAEQGIRLALKGLDDDALTEALAGRELKVRHADSRGLADAVESEAVRLAVVNRVAGLIGGVTPEEIVRLDRAHVPIVAASGFRPAVASDQVFAIGMRPAQQGFVLADHAAEELKLVDLVVLVDERREDFLATADAFVRQFTRLRQPKQAIAAPTPIRFGKDAKWEEIGKAISARAGLQGVVFAGTSRDWIELRRHVVTSAPLFFAGEDGDGANLAEGKQAIYVATAFAPDKDLPRVQAFAQKYRDAFKEEPDVAAALAYESLLIFAEALKQAGANLTIEKVQTALREVKDVPGIAGSLTMASDQIVRRVLYLARCEGSVVTPLKRYEADSLP